MNVGLAESGGVGRRLFAAAVQKSELKARMIEQLPVWLLVFLLIAAVVAMVQAGIYLARRAVAARPQTEPAVEGVGAVVGALLGLFGFMLAFTFSMAAQRRETRMSLLLGEVNSIGTTYLRTGLIPEPQRGMARALLQRYVQLRIQAAEQPEQLPAILKNSSAILDQLWLGAESLAGADLKNPEIVALYVDALNQTIDFQTSRVTVGRYRIPEVIWLAFAGLTILSSLAVGYNFGLQSLHRNHVMTALLAISFAAVTFLIFDLDHGNQGWLKIDQQPMYELRDQLSNSAPAARVN